MAAPSNDSITAGPALRAAVTALPAYIAGRQARSALTAALASNESHFEPLPSVRDVVIEESARINRYPDAAATVLRARIAAAVGVTDEEIAVGPGSVGVLQQIITTFCDAGTSVVFAWRSFEAYPILVGLAGATGRRIPLRPDEGHDLEAMAGAIDESTRVVLLCSPNNPTGVSIRGDELERFLRRIPSTVLVVLDEAYVEYAAGPEAIDAVDVYRRHPNVCILRTFSKAHGLAGLRVGYAIARPELAEGLRRTALPFGVSALAQRAAIASLGAVAEMRDRVDAVTRERSRVIAAARAAGWSVPDSSANFFWLRTDPSDVAALADAFSDADILVRGYTGDGVRVSLADPAANDRVLQVLRSVPSR